MTSTFPYFVLVALFIRGITLEGAIDGIVFYMKPDPVKLLLPKVSIIMVFRISVHGLLRITLKY